MTGDDSDTVEILVKCLGLFIAIVNGLDLDAYTAVPRAELEMHLADAQQALNRILRRIQVTG